MSRKVLIIGVDGGTWDVLGPAMDGGYMPYLRGLFDSGVSGVLESTLPAITPAAWGSFQTGMNPGENGVHDFFRWDKKSKTASLVNSSCLEDTVWDIASAGSKRVGVINVPMTYPVGKVNGYLVSGMFTPSIESDFTYPPELKSELLEAVDGYDILTLKKGFNGVEQGQFEAFVSQMCCNMENRMSAAKFVIGKEPLDLFMVHFQATDFVQHGLWCYLDPTSEYYDQQKRQYLFEKFYACLDEQIREVHEYFAETAGDELLTLIVSDHGFEANRKVINLGNWLAEQGYLKVNVGGAKKPLLKKITSVLRIGKLLSPFISKDTMQKAEESVLKYKNERYCWERSRAYARAGNSEGYIYLLEEDAAKFAALEEEIIAKLEGLVDPDSGAKVVRKVHRKAEIYHGKYIGLMPDLVVEPEDGYSFMGTFSAEADMFHKVSPAEDIHTGKHHKDGIVLAVGGDAASAGDIRAGIGDMTPTILYYLGVDAAKRFDGDVVTGLFQQKFLDENPVSDVGDGRVAVERSKNQKDYDDEESRLIEKRLEDLGYM